MAANWLNCKVTTVYHYSVYTVIFQSPMDRGGILGELLLQNVSVITSAIFYIACA